MTNQEAYDKATRGLLFQGERCIIRYEQCPDRVVCVFTNPQGQHCALGFILPEQLAQAHDQAMALNKIFLFLAQNVESEFQNDLRNVHNENEPAAWPSLLRQLATKYQLSTRVLDDTLAELAELSIILQPKEERSCVPC